MRNWGRVPQISTRRVMLLLQMPHPLGQHHHIAFRIAKSSQDDRLSFALLRLAVDDAAIFTDDPAGGHNVVHLQAEIRAPL